MQRGGFLFVRRPFTPRGHYSPLTDVPRRMGLDGYAAFNVRGSRYVKPLVRVFRAFGMVGMELISGLFQILEPTGMEN